MIRDTLKKNATELDKLNYALDHILHVESECGQICGYRELVNNLRSAIYAEEQDPIEATN